MSKKGSGSKKKVKKFQIELTPLSLSLWGACLFFVLAWIFVLGILVGRGFLPGAVTAFSDLKDQIGVLRQIVGPRKSGQVNPPDRRDPDPKLAFYEKLASKKDEARKATRAEPRVERPKKKTGPQKNPSKSDPSPKKGGPGKREEQKGQYTVQLASLDDRGRAERVTADLVKRGYPAYYYGVKVKGKTYYRIRCGRFLDRKSAGDYARKLRKEVNIQGYVSRVE